MRERERERDRESERERRNLLPNASNHLGNISGTAFQVAFGYVE